MLNMVQGGHDARSLILNIVQGSHVRYDARSLLNLVQGGPL